MGGRHRARRASPGRWSALDGYGLVELLVTVVIVGILAAIAIPMWRNSRHQAVVAVLQSDLTANALLVASERAAHEGFPMTAADSATCTSGVTTTLQASTEAAPLVLCSGVDGSALGAGSVVQALVPAKKTPTPSNTRTRTSTPRPSSSSTDEDDEEEESSSAPASTSRSSSSAPATTLSSSSAPATTLSSSSAPVTSSSIPTSESSSSSMSTSPPATTTPPDTTVVALPSDAWYCLTAVSQELPDEPWYWDSRGGGPQQGSCPTGGDGPA